MKNITLKILYLLFFINLNISFAQDYTFKNYKWEGKPTAFILPESLKNENEIIVDRKIKIEIVVEKNIAKQYYLIHDKIFINSDDAIEQNNKIYLPFGSNESVIKTEARVILKNGKIIKLDKKDIKEEIDEEKGVKYNYFAINGLEKGAIIEKIFMLEENPDLKGKLCKSIIEILIELILNG